MDSVNQKCSNLVWWRIQLVDFLHYMYVVNNVLIIFILEY